MSLFFSKFFETAKMGYFKVLMCVMYNLYVFVRFLYWTFCHFAYICMVYMFFLYLKFLIGHLALSFVRISDIRVTHARCTEFAIGLRIIWLKTLKVKDLPNYPILENLGQKV